MLKTSRQLSSLINSTAFPDGFHREINRVFAFDDHSYQEYSALYYTGNTQRNIRIVNPGGLGFQNLNIARNGFSVLKNLPTLKRMVAENQASSTVAADNVNGELARRFGVDFTYHLMSDFNEFDTPADGYQYFKRTLTDPVECISFATVSFMQKYLQMFGESQTKLLIKAYSVHSWKLRNGYLVPTKFYSTYRNDPDTTPLFFKANAEFFQLPDSYNYKSSTEYLTVMSNRWGASNTSGSTTRSLKAYNDRATNYFTFKAEEKKKHTTYLGVELELEDYDHDLDTQSLNTLSNHAIFKRDGSLSNGVEICTAPATLSVHKEAFKQFFELNGKEGLVAKENCGLHVHVDKSTLSKLHLANLHIFMNSDDNENNIVTIAGRQPNSYCAKQKLKYDHFINGISGGSRYSRLNYNNEATVEFRLFASTTKYDEFCTRLEFTQAVVDYTRPGISDVPVKDIPKWSNFVDYVGKNRGLYPQLYKGVCNV